MVAEEEAAFLSVERKAGEEPKAFGICVLLKLYYPNETKCVGVAVNRHRDVNNTPNKFKRKSCCLSSLSEKRESNVPFLVWELLAMNTFLSFKIVLLTFIRSTHAFIPIPSLVGGRRSLYHL